MVEGEKEQFELERQYVEEDKVRYGVIPRYNDIIISRTETMTQHCDLSFAPSLTASHTA